MPYIQDDAIEAIEAIKRDYYVAQMNLARDVIDTSDYWRHIGYCAGVANALMHLNVPQTDIDAIRNRAIEHHRIMTTERK